MKMGRNLMDKGMLRRRLFLNHQRGVALFSRPSCLQYYTWLEYSVSHDLVSLSMPRFIRFISILSNSIGIKPKNKYVVKSCLVDHSRSPSTFSFPSARLHYRRDYIYSVLQATSWPLRPLSKVFEQTFQTIILVRNYLKAGGRCNARHVNFCYTQYSKLQRWLSSSHLIAILTTIKWVRVMPTNGAGNNSNVGNSIPNATSYNILRRHDGCYARIRDRNKSSSVFDDCRQRACI